MILPFGVFYLLIAFSWVAPPTKLHLIAQNFDNFLCFPHSKIFLRMSSQKLEYILKGPNRQFLPIEQVREILFI